MLEFPDIFYAQTVGIISLIFGIWAFSQKDDIRFKRWVAFSSTILAIHYAMMGAYVGSGTALINGSRNLLSSFKNVPTSIAFIFVAFYLGYGSYRYEEWIDSLPIISSCMATIGVFYLSGIKMRTTLLISSTCFMMYDAYVGSIGPFIMQCFIWITNARTIYHLSRKKQVTPLERKAFAAKRGIHKVQERRFSSDNAPKESSVPKTVAPIFLQRTLKGRKSRTR